MSVDFGFIIYMENTLFFISNIFTSNDREKMAKNQVNAKQHPESKLSLFEFTFFTQVIIQKYMLLF